MNIAIFTIGTRGDVQPYVALGLGFQKAGHRVTIGAPANFEDFVTRHGLLFRALGGDFEKVIKSEAIEIISAKKRTFSNLISAAKQLKKETANYHIEGYQRMWEAAQEADVLILQTLVMPAADFAQKLNIPVFYAGLQPATPTGDYPLIGMSLPSLGAWLNRASYKFLAMLNQIPHKEYNRLRKELLNFPPKPRFSNPFLLNGKRIPTLYGFSPHLVRRPKDWPNSVKMCGFWFLEDQSNWQPDEDLQSFLDAGLPPVFIGFSSLTWNAKSHTKIIVEAVKQWGGRAIIATGWGGLDPKQFYEDLPENIHIIKSAPHSKIFPLMAGIVHHGGAGSTGAALLAGKPTLVCPDMVDQPFWAEQVFKCGVGPKPVALSKLTADIFAEKLEQLTTRTTRTTRTTYQKKAIEIAQKIKQEDGVAATITTVTKCFNNHSKV